MYEARVYRNECRGDHLVYCSVIVGETDLSIGSGRDLSEPALAAVKRYRTVLEDYIPRQPAFLTSLVPLDPLPGAAPLIRQMCAAATAAGVGPMAAVAGAISEAVGCELLAYAPEVIVENGGDIFLMTTRDRQVGIFAGKSPWSGKLALEVAPTDTPLGICTSSGTVGHSLSFGRADAAVIVAADTCLADAVATATGNRVRTGKDIESALGFAAGIPGVRGALIIIGGRMGVWGDLRLAKV